jgi:hypothetical protein
MFSFVTHLEIELAKQSLKLTEDGKRFYEIYVLCGEKVSLPNHFLEKL